ncbi:MAG: argininosuccinate synthase [Alphaproteobacteria bacterium]|jgi:argininosuccinate synthase
MQKPKVVLAYSGGLDTSVILKWLINRGFDVIAYTANVGQDDDFEAVREKALKCGAVKAYVADLRREFVEDYIFPCFKSGAVYEDRYLLGTSIARPVITKHHVRIAAEEGAEYIAHGATGKGNDQVRFELAAYALNPSIKIISPWKDPDFLNEFQGRPDMLAYAEKYGIEIKKTAGKSYSEDDNLLHISHESGLLEDPAVECPEEVYSKTVSPLNAPDRVTKIALTFKEGIPVRLENLEDGTVQTDALNLFTALNRLGAENGIGRLDMVENRFVGIKSRGVYETPGGFILHAAHADLTGMCLDREVFRLNREMADKMADLVYNGFWFSPEMNVVRTAIDACQKNVNGRVVLHLYKGNAFPAARSSETSTYNAHIASMDEHGGFDQRDSKGFIRINAVRLAADYHLRNGK